MKIHVNQYAYEKVLKKNTEVTIPTEPMAWQEYNHRVMYLVIPEFQTWGKTEEEKQQVWNLRIIKINSGVKEGKITYDSLAISQFESELTQMDKLQNYIEIEHCVINRLMNFPNEDRISVDTFKGKLKAVYEEIDDIINPK